MRITVSLMTLGVLALMLAPGPVAAQACGPCKLKIGLGFKHVHWEGGESMTLDGHGSGTYNDPCGTHHEAPPCGASLIEIRDAADTLRDLIWEGDLEGVANMIDSMERVSVNFMDGGIELSNECPAGRNVRVLAIATDDLVTLSQQ